MSFIFRMKKPLQNWFCSERKESLAHTLVLDLYCYTITGAGPRSTVDSASDSRARGPGFDTRFGHILSLLFPLTQEGQLSVTGESMCTKYWLTAYEGKVWLG